MVAMDAIASLPRQGVKWQVRFYKLCDRNIVIPIEDSAIENQRILPMAYPAKQLWPIPSPVGFLGRARGRGGGARRGGRGGRRGGRGRGAPGREGPMVDEGAPDAAIDGDTDMDEAGEGLGGHGEPAGDSVGESCDEVDDGISEPCSDADSSDVGLYVGMVEVLLLKVVSELYSTKFV